MSSIQQFYQLPRSIQQEVLDFMSFLAKKNGIELKEADIMSQRLSTLEGLQPWMGKDGFFSRAWIQQNVLKMTSDEIQAMAAELEADQQQEIESYVEKQILYGQANQKLIQMGVMPPPEDPNAESK